MIVCERINLVGERDLWRMHVRKFRITKTTWYVRYNVSSPICYITQFRYNQRKRWWDVRRVFWGAVARGREGGISVDRLQLHGQKDSIFKIWYFRSIVEPKRATACGTETPDVDTFVLAFNVHTYIVTFSLGFTLRHCSITALMHLRAPCIEVFLPFWLQAISSSERLTWNNAYT